MDTDMDMDQDQDHLQLIARFDALSSPPARRAVFHHILCQLNHYEWRDVRHRLDQISFQKDILGALPLELAVQIVQYLDLSELYTLRRVSRTWQFLLSSELACGAVFQRYLGRQTGASSPQSQLQYAKQRIRLERGQSALKATQDTSSMPVPQIGDAASLDYSSGRYAWIEESVIITHDLRTGTTRQYCTENRDAFYLTRISDSILTAITPRGYCHVWDLESDESAVFRIPSLNYIACVTSGVDVAIAFENHKHGPHDFILHWNFYSRVTRTIDVLPGIALMALNPAANALLTVHLEAKDNTTGSGVICIKNAQLRVTKHPLTPATTAAPANSSSTPNPTSTSYILDLPETTDPTCDILTRNSISLSFSNRIGILLTIIPQTSFTSASSCVIAISYDQRADHVSVHLLRQEHTPFWPLCMAPLDRGILYFIKNDNGKPKVWISNPDARVSHRPALSMDPQLPREATSRIYSYATRLTLRGDRDFLLMVDENGVKVWCFDEAVELPDVGRPLGVS